MSQPSKAILTSATPGNPHLLPDFLIIGAPKAGTTALFKALARHPEIFVSPEKEPRYFIHAGSKPAFPCPGGEGRAASVVWREEEYLALYRDRTPEQTAGEASTGYLAQPLAPRNAARSVPGARLIAVLRHPVERAFSQWLHMRNEGMEPLADFEAAWAAEPWRTAQGWRPEWHYQERGRYADHLQRWLEYFPREQLLILFYEDWLERPLDTLESIFRHIGVSNVAGLLVTRENVSSREPHWKWLHYRMTGRNAVREWAQCHLPLWVRDAITVPLFGVNLQPGPRIDPALRARLAVHFHDDIDRLEILTGRDLSCWRS